MWSILQKMRSVRKVVMPHISGADCLPDGSSNPLFGFHLVCLPLAACLLFSVLPLCFGPFSIYTTLVNQPLADRNRMQSIEWQEEFSIVTIDI